jgi:hypothetical protein
MHPSVEWEALARRIIDMSVEQKAIFHVLDLTELRQIVGVGEKPEIVHSVLCQRFAAIAKAKTAFVRARRRPDFTEREVEGSTR